LIRNTFHYDALSRPVLAKGGSLTDLGDKLKELRTQRRLSQREVARALGLTHTRWRDFETGVLHGSQRPVAPTPDQLRRIAGFFDFPFDVLAALAGFQPEPVLAPTTLSPEDIAVREMEDVYRRLAPNLQAVLLEVVRSFRQAIP
jgi:transcriptional regulator with XRE-family HTH domain